MKIISNFRDYYDYVPHLYGGGDPKIVFVRPRLNINRVARVDLTSFDEMAFKRINILGRYLTGRNNSYKSQLLIAGDRIFYYTKYEPVNPKLWENTYSLITQKVIDKVFNERFSWREEARNPKLASFINHQDKHFIDLCRHVGRPVFSLFSGNGGDWKVGEISPNLGEMGVASFIEAEDMYQNLSYLVGNLMKDSPDISPPVELSDKHRILKHGFDLKTSFRGKVK